MNKISFLACIGIIYVSCHVDHDIKFDIINSSNSSIYYAFSFAYPDTNLSLIDFVPYSGGNETLKILAHDGKTEGRGIFDLNPTTLVFIFDANTIETTPWDSIVKHYLVLKRYQLTKVDMEKNNWTISYP
jgi:hypothetical protein